MRLTAARKFRSTPLAATLAFGVALTLAACSSGADAASGDGSTAEGVANLALDDLGPDGIIGKGPNGEPPADVSAVELNEEDAAEARAGKFRVGVIVQTMAIDWAKLQVQGITETLEEYDAEVIGVVDPQFKVDQQISGIENLIQQRPDAIISIPVDDTATAEAHRKIGEAGIKLILMDNVPKGLTYPTDYQSMISADSQGNGWIAAQTLAAEIPEDGTVGIVGFGVDFFVTNERVTGVRDWFSKNRPDVTIKQTDFTKPDEATSVTENFLTANSDVDGLFVVWDAPAMGAVTAARTVGRDIPITTIDLGLEAAIEMASGGSIKGVGAQQPYDQGVAEALAALNAILGNETPAWIGVQSLPVVQRNVIEQYRHVWKQDPPADLAEACEASPECSSEG